MAEQEKEQSEKELGFPAISMCQIFPGRGFNALAPYALYFHNQSLLHVTRICQTNKAELNEKSIHRTD